MLVRSGSHWPTSVEDISWPANLTALAKALDVSINALRR